MADDSLTQDFDAHVLFTFAPIPEGPGFANRKARVKRWFFIAFAESWLAVWLFRAKVRLRAAGLSFPARLCDLLSRALFRVSIGDRVDAGRGLMITHGNVVIDGRTRIGEHCQINPWVTIGLSNSKRLGFSIDGPTIGNHVHIGTGAKVLGPITVGDYARIGANAVVVRDVPANCTAVGIPARIVGAPRRPEEVAGDPSGRDARLAQNMRNAIVDYRLKRQSLKSLIDTLLGSFEIGSDDLLATRRRFEDDLVFLDAAAAEGGAQTPAVVDALESLDAALLAHVRAGG